MACRVVNRCIRRLDEIKLCKKEHVCYIIGSKKLTYCGYSNDMRRRLRQHNGLIKGGAKYTSRAGPWRILALVRGFRSQKEGLQFEYAVKHAKKCGKRGIEKRKRSLLYVLEKEKWTRNAPLAHTVPLKVYIFEKSMKFKCKDKTHVTIVDLSK